MKKEDLNNTSNAKNRSSQSHGQKKSAPKNSSASKPSGTSNADGAKKANDKHQNLKQHHRNMSIVGIVLVIIVVIIGYVFYQHEKSRLDQLKKDITEEIQKEDAKTDELSPEDKQQVLERFDENTSKEATRGKAREDFTNALNNF